MRHLCMRFFKNVFHSVSAQIHYPKCINTLYSVTSVVPSRIKKSNLTNINESFTKTLTFIITVTRLKTLGQCNCIHVVWQPCSYHHEHGLTHLRPGIAWKVPVTGQHMQPLLRIIVNDMVKWFTKWSPAQLSFGMLCAIHLNYLRSSKHICVV